MRIPSYAVRFRRSAKAELLQATNDEPGLRQGILGWLQQEVAASPIAAQHTTLPLVPFFEAFMDYLEQAPNEHDHIWRQWLDDVAIRQLQALLMIAQRKPQWDFRYAEKVFQNPHLEMHCKIGCYYEVDHRELRVIAVAFRGLPGQQRS